MRIAQISDTHLVMGGDRDAASRRRDFEATLAHVNALSPLPDLLVHTGDLTHHGLIEEYEASKAILNHARMPYRLLVGNKDNRQNLKTVFDLPLDQSIASPFVQYFETQFKLDLLFLDTLCTNSNLGEYCVERLAQMNALTKYATQKPQVVFCHHPPFLANRCPAPFQFTSQEHYERLRQAIGSLPDVISVVCGHVHRFDFGTVLNAPAFAMPSVATSLRWGDYPPAMKSRPVYQLFTFDHRGNWTVETQIVDPV